MWFVDRLRFNGMFDCFGVAHGHGAIEGDRLVMENLFKDGQRSRAFFS